MIDKDGGPALPRELSVAINVDRRGPEGLTEIQERLASQLFDFDAIKFGAFLITLHDTRPEAPRSPVYFDVRVVPRFLDIKALAVQVYEGLLDSISSYNILAAIPIAATPFVSSLSDRLHIGMITPRTDSKAHGSGARVDGLLEGDRGKLVAIVVDDVIAAGDSKLKAIQILKENGVEVKDIVVLVDEELGGRERIEHAGYKVHAAFTISQLLSFYLRTGRITSEQHKETRQKLDALNQFLREINV